MICIIQEFKGHKKYTFYAHVLQKGKLAVKAWQTMYDENNKKK